MGLGRKQATSRLFLFGTFLGALFAMLSLWISPTQAATGINQKINFQGRLLNAAGATVPDGYYNIQFKIYQDGDGQSVGNTTGSPAGTLEWTESYLNANSQGVRVQNGFMSVQLGSITPFGSNIDWNQDTLWLSMNIGNTNASCTPFTSCAPDGEMVPMQAMTSAVYALNAMQLGGLTASSFGQLNASQTWTGVNTFRPSSDSTSAFRLQNQATGTAYVTGDSTNNQLILGTASSLTGKLAFATVGGGTLTVNPTSSASSFTITLPAETGTVCTTAASGACTVAGSGFVQLAPLAVQADNTTSNTIHINKTNSTGNIVELERGGSDVFTIGNTGNIVATGTYNSNAFNSTTLTFGGASPVISPGTTNTGLTAQANGTGTLTLNTTGAGTVNVGTTNSTAVNVGSSTAALNLQGMGAATSTNLLGFRVASDTNDRFNITANGTLNWGPGNGVSDASLFRTSSGQLSSNTNVLFSNTLTVGGSAFTTTPKFGIKPGSTTIGQIIQAASGQTADLFQFQDSTGANTLRVNAGADLDTIGNINTAFGGIGQYANYILYSEQFDNAAWAKSNITVTADQGQGPNVTGINIADQFASSAPNSTVQQTFTTTTSGYYTFAVWVRTTSGTQGVNLRLDSTGATPTTGTIATYTATTTWQRISVTENFTGTPSNIKPTIIMASGGGAVIHAWGAQLITGRVVPAYLLTTNSTIGTITGGLSINGSATFRAAVNSAGAFRVVNAGGGVLLNVDSTNNVTTAGFSLGVGTASTTTGTLSLYNSGGSGNIAFQAANPGSSTYILTVPAETGTLCTTGSICAGYASTTGVVLLAPGTAQADASTNSSIFINKTGGSGSILQLQKSATDVFVINNAGNITTSAGYTQTGTTANTFTGATTFSASGTALTVTNDATAGRIGIATTTFGTVNKLTVNPNNTTDNAAAVQINSTAVGDKALVVQGFLGQTANVFEVQNSTGSTLFNVTPGGSAVAPSGFVVGTNSQTAGAVSKYATAGTGGVSANDVVVLVNDGGNVRVTRTTTSRDIRVYGVSHGAASSGTTITIAISGNYQVTADTGAVALGDQLVTSTTSGQVTVDNNATSGILGTATSTKSAGSSGLVGVNIRPVSGQANPNFGAGNISTTGTINTNTFGASALTFSGANPIIGASTTNTNMTLQANGTGVLALNTTGAGTVNVGTANTGTIGIGSASSTTTMLGTVNINNSGSAATTIGSGVSGTGTITIQGGVSSNFSVVNATGKSVLSFTAPSTAGTVTYRLPAGGTGGSTYDVCTTQTVCAGYAASPGAGGYVQLAPSSVQVDSSTNSSIFINKTGASGNIAQLQKNGVDVFTIANNGNITATGTFNTNTFNATTLTFAGASPVISASTTNTGLTAQANGTGTLTLNTTGAGTVNLGTTNSTTIGIGNTGSAITLTGTTINLNSATLATNQTGTVALLNTNAVGVNAFGAATTINIGAQDGITTVNSDSLIVGLNGSSGVRGNGNAGFAVGSNGSSTGSYTTGATTFLSGTVTGASSNSGAVILQSGHSSTSGNTGTVNITSGNATSGNSGDVSLDVGTATGTRGTLSVGVANATTISIGNSSAAVTLAASALNLATNTVNLGTGAGPTTVGTSGSASGATRGITWKSGNTNGASSASGTVTLQSGDSTNSGATGAISIKSGNATSGASGAIDIDSGTATGGQYGAITIGSTNSVSLTLGNTGANTQTLIRGGSGASAIQISQGLGGTVTIGTTGSGSTVTLNCGAGTTTCNIGNNATDHSTIIGSATGVSATTVQSGSGGLTLTGNITASGTYNGNTFSSTALTFSGANPIIGAGTTNTSLTVRANGTGTLTLNTTGAGTVNLGTANTTTLGIGNASSANTILGTTGFTGITNINTTGTAATTIGAGNGTAGDVVIQGGAGTLVSATNSSGTSRLTFTAPSTAGIVTYRLPGGGTGGTTYDVCTTQTVCTGYLASGNYATISLNNLSSVAINTSLLPGVTNSIDVGSGSFTFQNGYFGTSVIAPSHQTADQSAASTASSAVSFRSGNATGTGSPSSTGNVTIKSGDSTNSTSGNVTIDTGSAGTTKGSVTIAATANVTLGNTSAAATTLIQGGSGGTAVSIQAAASGSINIGTTNVNSVAIGSTSNNGTLTFGQSTLGETVNIANAATAAATTVNILSGVGTAGIATLNLGNNTRATTINLGNINPAAARTISIGNTTATGNGVVDTINIATNPTTVAGGNTVNIANGTPTGSGTNIVNMGSVVGSSTTLINGGTGATGIQIIQGTGGGVVIGSPNTGSTVTIQCGAGTSSNCGFGVNANDHSTYIGSNVGVSNTVIQSGSGGINLNGAVTTSGSINGVTLSSTALTFSGANPVISSSTSNTGMTLQSNGTGILTLNSSGAGTVNVGTTNTTTIGIGSTTAAVQTLIQGGTGASALGLQVGAGGTIAIGTTAAATLSIGSTNAATVTSISGGTTASGNGALSLQVGNGGAINIGTTAQTSVQNIGNTSASSTTLINGGTSTTAIQVVQGTGGTLTLGGTGAGSIANLNCGAGTNTCNIGNNATDHTTILGSVTGTSATTIQAGSGGISLAMDTTLAANRNLTFASGTGRYVQTGFSGTTTDAFAITANSLTSGAAMRITNTNTNTTSANFAGVVFNTTNSQATTASTANIFGADFQFTQNSSVVSGSVNSAAVNIALAQNNSAPADNTVTSILNVANNDTGTGNLIAATNGIRIAATTSSNIVNGITLSGTFQSTLINAGSAYTVSSTGGVTQGGNLTFGGANPIISASTSGTTLTLQSTGTGTVSADTTGAGTVNVGATNAATVNVGNGGNTTNLSMNCAASAVTCNFGANTSDHTTRLGSSTGTSATIIQGGTAGISLTSGNTVASILSAGMTVRTTTNSATAFQVTNNNSNPVLVVDTSTAGMRIYNGLGGSNYLSLTYNDATTTATIAASAGTTAVGTGTGAISVIAGAGSAITMTANATSLWRTTAGTLTMQSGTSSDLILTAGSNVVNVSGTSVVKLGHSAGDPGTCTEGAIVYNTTTNTLRGCQGSTLAWNDLVNTTTPTMQQTYTSSTGGTTPEIKLDTTRGALDIQGDNGGSVTTLLNVRAGTGSGLGTPVFSVTSNGTVSMQDNTGADMLTADGANQLVQVGSSSPHSTAPIQFVLDNYQSQTAGAEPADIDGAMYYDADSHQFRCSANGFWSSCAINNISSSYVFEDEFLGGSAGSGSQVGVGALGWNVTQNTSCTVAYNQNVTGTGPGVQHDHPGTVRLATNTTNPAGCVMTQGGTSAGSPTLNQVLGAGDTYKAVIAVSTATGIMRTGWTNQTGTAAPTSGAWWQYTGGNLQYCYANNAAAVCATAQAMATNTWAQVEIHISNVTSGSVSITFTSSIGGTTTSDTTTSNFDAGTTNRLTPGASCITNATTAQQCYVDYIQWSGYNISGTGTRD